MFSRLVLLLVVPLVFADQQSALQQLQQALQQARRDGPCPEPPQALQNLPLNELSGVWYGVSTNIELQQDALNQRRCPRLNVQLQGNNIEAELRYVDNNGQDQLFNRRYTPIANEPGVFLQQNQNGQGNYENTDFHYRIVRIEGDNVLEYACQQQGNQHINFYNIMGRNRNPNAADQQAQAKLRQQVQENGDNRQMIDYDQQNCPQQN